MTTKQVWLAVLVTLLVTCLIGWNYLSFLPKIEPEFIHIGSETNIGEVVTITPRGFVLSPHDITKVYLGQNVTWNRTVIGIVKYIDGFNGYAYTYNKEITTIVPEEV